MFRVRQILREVCCVLLAVAPAVVWGKAATAPASKPVKPAKPAPEKLKLKPQDVCQFRIMGGNLVIETRVPEQVTGAVRRIIEVEGWTGTVEVRNRGGNFSLNHNVPRANGGLFLSITQNKSAVSISRQDNDGQKAVALNFNQSMPGAEGVQLTVTETNLRNGRSAVKANLSAKSMGELRQKHAKELREHLMPILRDFGAYGLDVDPAIARQVLIEYNADADFQAKVMKLVAQLDADAFPDREAASEQLKKLCPEAAPVLRGIDRATLTEQQRLSVADVLTATRQLSPAELSKLRRDRDFLLDCLYCEDEALRLLAVQRLGELLGRPVTFDTKAPPDQRAAAIESIRVPKK
jgi:hypothetical protein